MAFPDGYAVFEAEHNYQSNHEDEISLKIGDKCYVKEPVINPTGWLLGQNTRTNNVGQFPGTYCRRLKPVTPDQALPPLPPKPQPKRMFILNRITLSSLLLPNYCDTQVNYFYFIFYFFLFIF